MKLLQRHPLPLFLAFQAALLFYRLDLLPIWDDEHGTLKLIRLPLSELLAFLRSAIHPPLYFCLLRLWVRLPWPGSLISQVRAVSALACVAVFFAWQWLGAPRLRLQFGYSVAAVLLLYTHYAPGLAVIVSVSPVALWRRTWRALLLPTC